MPNLGAPEIIIIAIVVLALFGYKKLPDAARAVGRSARIFKAETKGLREDPGPSDLDTKAQAEYTRSPIEADRPVPSPAPTPSPAPEQTPTPAPTPTDQQR
jgi:sec-independent protein translocase protein TatA